MRLQLWRLKYWSLSSRGFDIPLSWSLAVDWSLVPPTRRMILTLHFGRRGRHFFFDWA